jgi:hypothetical protein
MPGPKKPRRRPLSFFDAQDRVVGLQQIYRTDAFGSDRAKTIAAKHHEALNEVSTPEPDAELEDSELDDVERRAAIARERMRRAGMDI